MAGVEVSLLIMVGTSDSFYARFYMCEFLLAANCDGAAKHRLVCWQYCVKMINNIYKKIT